jgi:hypothetical protein
VQSSRGIKYLSHKLDQTEAFKEFGHFGEIDTICFLKELAEYQGNYRKAEEIRTTYTTI